MTPGAEEKAALRRALRARLREASPAAREAAAREVARAVWTLPEVAGARVLLLYASLPDEVPTDAIAREALRRGKGVVYPRCVVPTREMTLHALERLEELEEGSYGIREPHPACPLVRVEEVDAALVPGLGWDAEGRRIGRGAGYYDRLFADPAWRGFRCGVFLAAQELPRIPADPWDAPLHAVVTERGARRFSTPRPPSS